MADQDIEYFKRRERAERDSAERAADASARCVHLALAEGYAQRLRLLMPSAAIPSLA